MRGVWECGVWCAVCGKLIHELIQPRRLLSPPRCHPPRHQVLCRRKLGPGGADAGGGQLQQGLLDGGLDSLLQQVGSTGARACLG